MKIIFRIFLICLPPFTIIPLTPTLNWAETNPSQVTITASGKIPGSCAFTNPTNAELLSDGERKQLSGMLTVNLNCTTPATVEIRRTQVTKSPGRGVLITQATLVHPISGHQTQKYTLDQVGENTVTVEINIKSNRQEMLTSGDYNAEIYLSATPN